MGRWDASYQGEPKKKGGDWKTDLRKQIKNSRIEYDRLGRLIERMTRHQEDTFRRMLQMEELFEGTPYGSSVGFRGGQGGQAETETA